MAGYSGNKQAAPILLDMLRRQKPYDGDMSTGVATIHEGKLYYKKVIGDVDTFLREFDLNDLPGTIGIAHTRPGGQKDTVPMHPNLNPSETMALVTNGTTPATKYCEKWDKAATCWRKTAIPSCSDFPIPKVQVPSCRPTEITFPLLKSDKAPLYFDDLERAVGREMRDLWPDDHTCIQHARLVYDLLWQFDREGRLKREMRIQDHPHGQRHRWYFWLED